MWSVSDDALGGGARNRRSGCRVGLRPALPTSRLRPGPHDRARRPRRRGRCPGGISACVAPRRGLRPAAGERRRLAAHDHPEPRDRRRAGATSGRVRPVCPDRARRRYRASGLRTIWRSSATTPRVSVPRSLGSPRSSVERSCWPVCWDTPRARWARSRTSHSVPPRPGSAPPLQRLRVALVTEEPAEE